MPCNKSAIKIKKLSKDLVSGTTAPSLKTCQGGSWGPGMSGMKECGCIPGLQDKSGLSTASVVIEDEHLADSKGIFPEHGGLLVESSGSRADKHPYLIAECRDPHVGHLERWGQGKKMGCITFPREGGGASDPFKYVYCRRQLLFFFLEIVF